MPTISCYRCGREIAAERIDLEGWIVLHAWEDGARCSSALTADITITLRVYAHAIPAMHAEATAKAAALIDSI